MSKINILSKDIYNKIAAGEVVDKPASVVKELVENSIDAGATNITIEILDGGIKQIKVSDNGCGIDRDDYDKVFLAHATSKVKNIEDLASIGTLGFRGEALSSIASVSKVVLSSKTKNSQEGYQISCEGGELSNITPIGSAPGTYMVISDLFYNIPARKKFLRKPKLEENDITNYIARLIMANPDISLKYVADNKIVYHSFGTGLYDAIYTIYGKIIVDNIIEVKFERGDFKFSGYISKPTFSKANRTYQTLIVNGRYVINQSISTAINRAYENFMMKGSFPFFVLNLNIPLDKVDVNVHPNKLEVKFEDSNSVFGMVYSEILNILYNCQNSKTISTFDNQTNETVDKSKLNIIEDVGSNYSNENSNKANDDDIIEVSLTSKVEYESNKEDIENDQYSRAVLQAQNDNFNLVPFTSNSDFDFKIKSPTSSKLDIDNIEKIVKDQQTIFEDNTKYNDQKSLFDNDSYKIIGTLFNTYIVIEFNEKMILVDQHAGHERILYDKYCNELSQKKVAVQPLLVPFVLDVNYKESSFLNENLDLLVEMGVEIEQFGESSFKISAVPMLFDNLDIDKFFLEILSNLDNKLILSKNDSIKEFIAKKACRSAVKANDVLSTNEITELINTINEPNQVLLCPHGRPIIVDVSKNEIEKWFKRIV